VRFQQEQALRTEMNGMRDFTDWPPHRNVPELRKIGFETNEVCSASKAGVTIASSAKARSGRAKANLRP
jgi:hypothetical protein